MVNLATLNYLPETVQWEAQIPRLEDGWWPTGGAVNPAADSGLLNWQPGLLANRTAFLKGVIDGAGLGATAVPLVTLNSAQARVTGTYRFASGDANTPASGVAGTVQVAAASASAVNQTAFDSASTRIWTRFWNGTVWSAWDLVWSSARGTRSFGAAGYVTLPDGMMFQWGGGSIVFTGGIGLGGSYSITFPTTFPVACRRVMLTSSGNTLEAGELTYSDTARTVSGATILAVRNVNLNTSGSEIAEFNFLAIGN
jgi:hypothetical protein